VAETAGVRAVGRDAVTALGGDDGRSRVLTHGQHPAGGDVGVLQQVQGHVPVVGRGFRIIDDPAQLGQVGGAQEMGQIAERGVRERLDRRLIDLQHGIVAAPAHPVSVHIETAHGGLDRSEWELVDIGERRHQSTPAPLSSSMAAAL